MVSTIEKKRNLESQIQRIKKLAVLKCVTKTQVDIEESCRIWEEKNGRTATEASRKEITQRLTVYMSRYGINLIIRPNLKK